MAAYKQRCIVCKNSWAMVTSFKQKFVVCVNCEMKVVEQKVEDKDFVKLFKIPLEWYKENPFLRSIRYQYGRWGSLTEKQLGAFEKTVKEMKKKKKK